MIKLLIAIWILIIGFLIGLLLGLSKPELDKSISEEIKGGKTFWVGKVHFTPTKYKNLYLAETVNSGIKKRE